MRRIALATANRAERGILQPVVSRLQEKAKRGEIEFDLWEGPFFDQEHVFAIRGEEYLSQHPMPDVALVPADRFEMVDLAQYLYYEQVPIFHLWAGIGYTGTWDDLNRRVISSFSYLMLTEDEECRQRLIASGEEPWRCITTGTTHYDDLQVDESLVPDVEYDLGLVNTNEFETYGAEFIRSVLWPLLIRGRFVVWVGGDGGNNFPASGAWEASAKFLTNVPRSQFLGLLKNCRRFLTNSSAGVYEAPYFGKEVVHVGQRNAERKTGALNPNELMMDHGPLPSHDVHCPSDYIVELLCTYPLDKIKMLKVYR